MRIDLNCAQCGGNRFEYPPVLADDAIITCADCGHVVGTFAELQQQVLEALERRKALPGGTGTL